MGRTGCWDLFPASITFCPPLCVTPFLPDEEVGWPLLELLTQEGREARKRGAEKVFKHVFQVQHLEHPTSVNEPMKPRDAGTGRVKRLSPRATIHPVPNSRSFPLSTGDTGETQGKREGSILPFLLPLPKAGEAAGPSLRETAQQPLRARGGVSPSRGTRGAAASPPSSPSSSAPFCF